MRTVLIIALLTILQHVKAQQNAAASVAEWQQSVITANALKTSMPPGMLRISNRQVPAAKIPGDILRQIQAKSSITYNNLPAKHMTSRRTDYLSETPNPACIDSSFTRLLGITNGFIYVNSVTQTYDGGALVPCFFEDSSATSNTSSGLLIKINTEGTISWIRQFDCPLSPAFPHTSMIKAFELPGRDIICYGTLDISPTVNVSKTIVCRLTSAGTLIWKNILYSNIGIINSPAGTFTYFFEGAAEGLNGDVILTGTANTTFSSSGKFATVVRLNSTGQVVWDANYGNYGTDGSYLFGAEGVNAFVVNGEIKLVGLSHGSNNPLTPAAIAVVTLNYSNGSLINKRFFRPVYPDINEEFEKTFSYWSSKCIRLQNGRYIFSGKLFSGFMNTTAIKEYFGVVEFDAGFNLVKAYTIRSGLTSNYYNNYLHFDPSGKALVTVLEYLADYEANVFFAAYENGQFLKQRKVYYPATGMPGTNGFIFLPDNGYAYLQTHFLPEPDVKSYIEFRKMHNSDTTSLCFGSDSLLLSFAPLNIIEDPAYFYFDANRPNEMLTSAEPVTISDTLTHNAVIGCQQKNYCDTVKIHGQSGICGVNNPVTYTSFKNRECGAIVQWNINPNAIDSFSIVNDTTLRVWYKNSINWQGYLYATLPAGACNAPARDSLLIHLIASPQPVNLGPDTTLCNQNTLQLHAGPLYSSYLWQDGSTDSLLSINQPGTFWVQVNDACGNISRDSITVTPLVVQADIGPDRVKCNADTIWLQAPGGFIAYQWSNNYYISSLTTAQTVVNPPIDTVYYLRAEKFAGCYAYDTVRIRVNTSPPIQLGPDTRFCVGDSLVVNAGNGFSQYNWSTGATAPRLLLHNAGTYWVTATAANGCQSRDTIVIGPLYSLPVVNLGADAPLCTGDKRVLNAGSGYTNYTWSNGSSSPSITVSNVGIYYVGLTDVNGCKGSDTAIVTQLLPLPAAFMPADLAICNYGITELKPLLNYPQYQWSTGSRQPSISITQPGLYWLQVTDNNNCIGRDSIQVSLKECIKGVYVPTAFTPGNDGRNDLLKPLVFGNVVKYEFVVYNRAGQMMFKSNNPAEGWNGKHNGNELSSGVFAWTCRYQLTGENEQLQKGTVGLIR